MAATNGEGAEANTNRLLTPSHRGQLIGYRSRGCILVIPIHVVRTMLGNGVPMRLPVGGLSTSNGLIPGIRSGILRRSVKSFTYVNGGKLQRSIHSVLAGSSPRSNSLKKGC